MTTREYLIRAALLAGVFLLVRHSATEPNRDPPEVRATYRGRVLPSTHRGAIGFRVARTVER